MNTFSKKRYMEENILGYGIIYFKPNSKLNINSVYINKKHIGYNLINSENGNDYHVIKLDILCCVKPSLIPIVPDKKKISFKKLLTNPKSFF